MDEIRKGQIALAFLKNEILFQHRGWSMFRRYLFYEIEYTAKALGISVIEVERFLDDIGQEVHEPLRKQELKNSEESTEHLNQSKNAR